MSRPAVRPRPELLVLLVLAALTLPACQGSGGDDQSSGFKVTFTSSAPSASAEVVFVRLREAHGSLITLDIVGLGVTPPLDGLDVALAFDPAVLEARSVAPETFLGRCGSTRPDNTLLLCADSAANGAANTTGVLLFSAFPQGTAPTPVVLAGSEVLATVTFRARSRGVSPIYFHDASQPAPGGSISQVTSGSDPAGAAAVAFEPDGPGAAEVEVRR